MVNGRTPKNVIDTALIIYAAGRGTRKGREGKRRRRTWARHAVVLADNGRLDEMRPFLAKRPVAVVQ